MTNPNCDNNKCTTAIGEVRVYPLGAGGNLIVCRSCWHHENRYREQRQREAMRAGDTRAAAAAKWPIESWDAATVYAGAPVTPAELQFKYVLVSQAFKFEGRIYRKESTRAAREYGTRSERREFEPTTIVDMIDEPNL